MTLVKKIFFFIVLLFPVTGVIAQIKIDHVPDAQGKLIRYNNTSHFLNSFKVLPAAKASALGNWANKAMDIICQSSRLNSPVGYNAKVAVYASDLELKEKEPNLKILCALRYLVKDSRYTGIKESMDGADLYLDINAFDLFYQMGNYWKDCSQLKFPLFFEEPLLTDSTNNYIEFQYKGDPVRIVMAGNKPLFVPLTRKEFAQFFILRGQAALKEDQEALESSRKGKVTLTKLMATENEADKAYSASTLKSIDYDIKKWEINIKQQEIENQTCKTWMNSLSQQEAAAPVRLDYNKKSNSQRFGGLDQLVSVGRREGTLLVKLNPAFYNHSPNAPVAQMIVLYYAWAKVGFTQASDFLQQAILDIFNNMDYHQLKESMK